MQKSENDTLENVEKYSKFGIEGTSWLGFRDIPSLINKHVKLSQRVLDYGCGAGRSTRFLKSIGFNPIGMDISKNALTQAKNLDSDTQFVVLENSTIPVVDEFYDFIFSSYVFLVLSDKKSMLKILKEFNRSLKKNGIMILITGSEELHSSNNDWLSYDVNFPENENLISGSICKIKNKDVGAVFYDYHWTEEDYRKLFEIAGLTLVQTHKPLGDLRDPYIWKDELKVSPHLIYVLRKD